MTEQPTQNAATPGGFDDCDCWEARSEDSGSAGSLVDFIDDDVITEFNRAGLPAWVDAIMAVDAPAARAWAPPARALKIRQPYLNMVLAGDKTWEIRSRRTRVRGRVALAEVGTGMILGEAVLSDSIPKTDAEMDACVAFHALPNWRHAFVAKYAQRHAWILEDARRVKPVRFQNTGAVTWEILRGKIPPQVEASTVVMPRPAAADQLGTVEDDGTEGGDNARTRRRVRPRPLE